MRRWLVLVSAILHISLVLGLFVAGFWHLEQLDRPKLTVALSQPLPPPPAPAGGAAPKHAPVLTPKHVTHDLVVPPEVKPVEAARPTEAIIPGNGSGEGSGQGSGDPKSTSDCVDDCGPGDGSGSAAKKPVVEQHHDDVVVPPLVFRALRISGETQIHPSDVDKTAIARDGRDKVIAVFKTCVTESGAAGPVTMMKSSGYAGYDALLIEGLRGWTYRPYEIGGRRVPACGVVTFVYQIQ
jgi:hypothetical protein